MSFYGFYLKVHKPSLKCLQVTFNAINVFVACCSYDFAWGQFVFSFESERNRWVLRVIKSLFQSKIKYREWFCFEFCIKNLTWNIYSIELNVRCNVWI